MSHEHNINNSRKWNILYCYLTICVFCLKIAGNYSGKRKLHRGVIFSSRIIYFIMGWAGKNRVQFSKIDFLLNCYTIFFNIVSTNNINQSTIKIWSEINIYLITRFHKQKLKSVRKVCKKCTHFLHYNKE